MTDSEVIQRIERLEATVRKFLELSRRRCTRGGKRRQTAEDAFYADHPCAPLCRTQERDARRGRQRDGRHAYRTPDRGHAPIRGTHGPDQDDWRSVLAQYGGTAI